MKKGKYWLLAIQQTVGEYESLIYSAHEDNFDPEEYVKNFYSNPDKMEEEGSGIYYFNDGEVACQIYRFQEIPKQDYDIFKKYI